MTHRLIASVAFGLVAYVACIGAALAQGSATLSWEPPTAFTNGASLNPATDLTGYGVYVDGARAATAPNTVSSYIVDNLAYGSHEFWVTAIATNGNESAMSNAATKVVVDDRVPRPPRLLDVILAWLRSVWGWFA